MANSEDNERRQKLVIKDRRRFDADGNALKEDEDIKASSEKTGPNSVESDTSQSGTKSVAGTGEMQIDFRSFIMSLATQALMQLGDIKAPSGVDIKIDKVMAKQTIDILIMLAEKTKGNLDKTEAALMEDIVHNLQLSYVNKL